MKLVSFDVEGKDRLGLLVENNIYPVFELNPSLPLNMKSFLEAGEEAMEILGRLEQHIRNEPRKFNSYPLPSMMLLAPVPRPTSCRDGYAFRQHVETARRNRKVPMIPEFDSYPVFYFTNHNSMIGPGDVPCMPDHFQKLDFELEVAIVIGKGGRNIRAKDADSYIAGYTVMNDLSARTLQMEEMLLNLGPAKGKDFATAIGPSLVTPDELASYLVPPPKGHVGNQYDRKMKAFVNG